MSIQSADPEDLRHKAKGLIGAVVQVAIRGMLRRARSKGSLSVAGSNRGI